MRRAIVPFAVLLLTVATTEGVRAQGWSPAIQTRYGPRTGHAMAYDSARARIVVFGGAVVIGSGSTSYLADTSEWDGTLWRQVSSSGPSPRSGAAMAYDAARSRGVLFGGAFSDGSGTTNYGDTWEWDGTMWSQRSTSGPSPRTGAVMAYDSVRHRVVLFGGSGGSAFGDTWEWDGTAWAPKAASGPLSGVAMADEGNGHVLLYRSNGETWDWNGTAWTQHVVAGPSPRTGAAMAYDSPRNRVVLVGGFDGGSSTYFGDTWEWNPATGTWTQVSSSGPSPRVGAKTAYDVATGRVVLFGGVVVVGGTSTYYGDTWKWDGTAWTTHALSPGSGVAMADEGNGHVLLFRINGETWDWDGTAWTQYVVSGPSPRNGVAMAYDSARNRVVLFGGSYFNGQTIYLGDTWEWNPAATTWTQVSSSGPSPRVSAKTAYDVASSRVVLFGGSYFNGVSTVYYGDTWEWDGAAGTWTQMPSSGTRRTGHAMAYDAARARVVLFGGSDATTYLGDTWEWDGTLWTQKSSSGPSARRGSAMAYVGTGRVVLFGGSFSDGSSTTLYDDTWEWNGTAWIERTSPMQPTARSGHAMAYDSMRERVVLFGGTDAFGGIDDTWEYNGCLALTWYRDADSDGHGDFAVSIVSCSQPSGHVAVGDDCDDADPNTYVNAPEANDGRDNQCGVHDCDSARRDCGYGVVDEITGASVFIGSNFCWPPQAGATNYQVVRSPQPDFSAGCITGTIVSPDHCVLDFTPPPPGGAYYYLIRALSPHVGSWGQHSDGTERTGGCLPP